MFPATGELVSSHWTYDCAFPYSTISTSITRNFPQGYHQDFRGGSTSISAMSKWQFLRRISQNFREKRKYIAVGKPGKLPRKEAINCREKNRGISVRRGGIFP
jgi:hypothetical protein